MIAAQNSIFFGSASSLFGLLVSDSIVTFLLNKGISNSIARTDGNSISIGEAMMALALVGRIHLLPMTAIAPLK
ncbi:hypothetical protein CKO51_13365 [Rhodopirellula sp. SM50]|nr:hypothetical protein CKO51_13365 [Rhodopirellula sp. SM50]